MHLHDVLRVRARLPTDHDPEHQVVVRIPRSAFGVGNGRLVQRRDAPPRAELACRGVRTIVDKDATPPHEPQLTTRYGGLRVLFSYQLAGRGRLKPEPGTSLDLAALEDAVRDGGFTPRELTLTARGRLSELHGTPVLELTDGTVLMLAEGGRANELLKLTRGSAVRVEGRAVLEQADDHTAHPYTLTVTSFEVL